MKRILLALALVGGLWAPAQAQVQDNMSGNETWQAGQGPGGPGAYITSNLVAGRTAHVLNAMAASVIIGATAATSAITDGGSFLITAQPAAGTLTLTLPANPVPDGAVISFCNVTGSAFATNVVNVAANTNQTLAVAVALTTLAAGACVREQFHRATTTWYRVGS